MEYRIYLEKQQRTSGSESYVDVLKWHIIREENEYTTKGFVF